jgi:ferredoxin--NADP+ reductase
MPKFKVAIVGAGPAGYFAAQALQNLQTDELKFAIDMIERLPTPWGLVRSGVAPDHPKIKTVAKVFEKIATSDGFSLYGNVELGTDVSLDVLKAKYDAVVIATGSAVGRKLGIPGEDLPGSISAAEFVPWYNGHPDFANHTPNLDCDTAVVIGAGNVAMDVARMLALEPSELDATDTATHALEALRNSRIRKVVISARRGPEFVAFTSPELRDLPKLEHTNVVMHASDISAAIERAGAEPDKEVRNNLEAMRLISELEQGKHARTMEFQFLCTSTEFRGNGKVEEVVFTTSTGEERVIKTGLVITAIGYEAEPLAGIPYEKGKVLNNDGHVSENLYVVGWAKRGPSGVIGTNKSDAADVMNLLVAALKESKPTAELSSLITTNKVISQSHWESINAAEIAAGEPHGKPRIKAVSREELLRLGGHIN